MSTPSRLDDWEARLNAYLNTVAKNPFEWGQHDCCSFAAGAVEAMTGVDLYAPFRGKYRSANGAARALRRIGAGDLDATLTALLGEPFHPSRTHRGDIVATADGVGVVATDFAWFVGDAGLVKVRRADWQKAWRP